MTAEAESIPINTPKRRGRQRKSAILPTTIGDWFTRPARNYDASSGGLSHNRTLSVYGQPLTIEAFNAGLINHADWDLLNKTLTGTYSPFVLAVVSEFSRAARGLPKAESKNYDAKKQLAMLAAIRAQVDSPKSPFTRQVYSKFKQAGVTSFGILASLSLADRTECIDANANTVSNNRNWHTLVTKSGLSVLEGSWFSVRHALWHRRVTLSAIAADYYSPEKITGDLVHIAEKCRGIGLRNIHYTSPRLAALAVENAMRIAFYDHSCVHRLTGCDRSADLRGCLHIGQTGATIQTAFAKADSMSARTVKHIETSLAARVAEFERDHARVVWQPTR